QAKPLPSGASISARRSAWAHLMWAHDRVSMTWSGQTASISASACGQEASPVRMSISMLISSAVPSKLGVLNHGGTFYKGFPLPVVPHHLRTSPHDLHAAQPALRP